MQICDIFTGIFLYILSAIFLLNSSSLPNDSKVVPLCMAISLIVLGTLLIVKTIKNKKNELSFKGAKRVFLVLGFTTLYVICINFIGFYVTTPFYLGIMIRMLGMKNMKLTIIIPICVVVFIYVVFGIIFKVPVPSGMFI